jgi:hypothetical protein
MEDSRFGKVSPVSNSILNLQNVSFKIGLLMARARGLLQRIQAVTIKFEARFGH